MLLTVPYQSIELSKLKLHPFYMDKRGRKVGHITYGDLYDLPVLTPPLTSVKYDATMNRLQFDMTGNRPFVTKWNAIQDRIMELVQANAQSIFSRSYDPEGIQALFQKLLSSGTLHIYAFPSTPVQMEDGSTVNLVDAKAEQLRCIIRIHGLILLERGGAYQVRIQHSIPKLWACK